MKRTLPPLNALRAFEVAARAGGFTRAARELLVSQGAVSRHVALLESFLGITLFHRSHRQVQLTQEGRTYAAAIRIALDDIEQATREVRATRARRSLHIKVYSTLAICWLVPRLGRFHALYPEMAVIISSSPEPADMAHEDVLFTVDHGTDQRGRVTIHSSRSN
jgi:LysR family transcriptional regulator, glycine cleavage system transcriptional activator